MNTRFKKILQAYISDLKKSTFVENKYLFIVINEVIFFKYLNFGMLTENLGSFVGKGNECCIRPWSYRAAYYARLY